MEQSVRKEFVWTIATSPGNHWGVFLNFVTRRVERKLNFSEKTFIAKDSALLVWKITDFENIFQKIKFQYNWNGSYFNTPEKNPLHNQQALKKVYEQWYEHRCFDILFSSRFIAKLKLVVGGYPGVISLVTAFSFCIRVNRCWTFKVAKFSY